MSVQSQDVRAVLAPTRPKAEGGTSSGIVILFSLASLLSAALLFVVQPLVGRMVLPAFGGSPQVWTTSMLFFQTALLVGYGYTHITTTRLSRRVQPWVHLAVLVGPLLVLPIALTVTPSGRGGITPSFELLAAMTLGVAAPFIVIATSGPLIQRWFSWTNHSRAADPYFLYAAGNVGSVAGLLAYPLILEPLLSVDDQSRLWAAGYLIAGLLLTLCAIWASVNPIADSADTARPSPERGDPVGGSRATRWMLWAFVPSSMMIGATSYISTDVAAVPMLWVIPLALYLLTFVVAFSRRGQQAMRAARWLLPVTVVVALVVRPTGYGAPVAVAGQLLLVVVVGLVAHGLLAEDRPAPNQLTRFYLYLSIGGALGGFFNGIVAPLVFPTVLEHGLVAALALALVVLWRSPVAGGDDWSATKRVTLAAVLGLIPFAALLVPSLVAAALDLPSSAVLAVVLLPLLGLRGRSGSVAIGVVVLALVPTAAQLANSELVERTFFGVHRVQSIDDVTQLSHGTTLHGWQDLSTSASRRQPLGYYHTEGPAGDLAAIAGSRGDLGVIGLGSGAMAAHARLEQRVVFHEIDPAIVDIAQERFTYLADSPGNIEIVLGDGRLTMADVTDSYGLLVIDAFSSDSIPVHLLTVEAMTTYLDAITSNGVIAVHVSNRYLDLVPILKAAAEDLGADAVVNNWDGDAEGGTPAQWVAIARTPSDLAELRQEGWSELPTRQVRWTDQRSDLLSVLRSQSSGEVDDPDQVRGGRGGTS